ncbi:MAG: hypothetical protein OEZ31_04280 [Nitrospirota bacterium]|nr:hypothetical protein [Nitrospirota bacterium]MDH5768159.1 hypothetical protein [Nitrospirota bacterium]
MKRLRTEEPQLKAADYDQKVVPPVKVSSVEFQKTIAAYSGRRIGTADEIMLGRMARWRGIAGKITAFFCVLFIVSLLDGCQAQLRQQINVLNVLPGATEKITGPLEKRVSIQELTYTSSSDLIQLSFIEIDAGFWFGQPMWRALVIVSPHIKPGEYRLEVMPRDTVQKAQGLIPFLIKVYQDQLSLRQSFKSAIKRYSGISPWLVSGFFFLPIILGFGAIFLMSKKMEKLMVRSGKAEIYQVWGRMAGCEVAFGLGIKQGIHPGSCLTLLDENGRPVGVVVVQKVSETDSVAFVEEITGLDHRVKPGYIVSIDKY